MAETVTVAAFNARVKQIRERALTEDGGRLVETLRLAKLVAHRLPGGDHQFLRLHEQRINAGLHQRLEVDDMRHHHAMRERVEKAIADTVELLAQEEARAELAKAMAETPAQAQARADATRTAEQAPSSVRV